MGDWLLQAGLDNLRSGITEVQEKIRFDEDVAPGTRQNMGEMCELMRRITDLIALKEGCCPVL